MFDRSQKERKEEREKRHTFISHHLSHEWIGLMVKMSFDRPRVFGFYSNYYYYYYSSSYLILFFTAQIVDKLIHIIKQISRTHTHTHKYVNARFTTHTYESCNEISFAKMKENLKSCYMDVLV